MNKVLALTAALLLAAPVANAATVFATAIDDSGVTNTNTASGRDDTTNALGAPDGDFAALGLGGVAILEFGVEFTGDIHVWEQTFGNRLGYVETVDIFGITKGGTETFLTSIDNSMEKMTFTTTGVFTKLKFVDTSPVLAGRDGFDIDAVGVNPVPLPATAALLLAGIGAVAVARRRA